MKKVQCLLLVIMLLWCLLLLIPAAAEARAETVFEEGDFQYTVLEDGTAEITRFVGNVLVDELTVPDTLGGHVVTGIGDKAFGSLTRLKSVTIPDNVIRVGNNPFSSCLSLEKIAVSPDHPTLETIGGALYSKPESRLICYPCALTETECAIPQGTAVIGDSAFFCCDRLIRVMIPDSVTEIGSYAFCGCRGLTGIVIPGSVVSVGTNPFIDCISMTAITLSPDHPVLTMTDGVLFSKPDRKLICCPCSAPAAEYAIPQGTVLIGDMAFYACEDLADVSIPDSVTRVGDYAFCNCGSIRELMIPDSVTFIGEGAFQGCHSLTGLTIPDGVDRVEDWTFAFCDQLISVKLPDTVTGIGNGAFICCFSLNGITIPGRVTGIGEGTFDSCTSLIHITIPGSVTIIGDWAFARCDALTDITIPDSVTSIGISAFADCRSLTLTVPRGSYAAQYCQENDLIYIYQDTN